MIELDYLSKKYNSKVDLFILYINKLIYNKLRSNHHKIQLFYESLFLGTNI